MRNLFLRDSLAGIDVGIGVKEGVTAARATNKVLSNGGADVIAKLTPEQINLVRNAVRLEEAGDAAAAEAIYRRLQSNLGLSNTELSEIKSSIGSAYRQRGKIREITTLTNANVEIAASEVLSRYNPGSGFSGAYNPETDRWIALASGDASLLSGEPVQTVARAGGHRAAELELMSRIGNLDRGRNVGFVLVWEGEERVSLRWNSGTINSRNFRRRAAPEEYREAIIEAIKSTTGFEVVE